MILNIESPNRAELAPLFVRHRHLRVVIDAILQGYCGTDDAIEIQINTNKAYRRMGLATAVGATLLVHCLEHGIDPHWDAGTPASERVAEKLGYLPDSTYEWLVLNG